MDELSDVSNNYKVVVVLGSVSRPAQFVTVSGQGWCPRPSVGVRDLE